MQAATKLKDAAIGGLDRTSQTERALAEVQDVLKNERVGWKDSKGGFEREMVAVAADVDAEAMEIEGTVYRRVLRREQE